MTGPVRDPFLPSSLIAPLFAIFSWMRFARLRTHSRLHGMQARLTRARVMASKRLRNMGGDRRNARCPSGCVKKLND